MRSRSHVMRSLRSPRSECSRADCQTGANAGSRIMDGLSTTVVDGAAAAGAAGAGEATAATAAGEIWESTSCLAAMR
eukprot:1330203-Rhodomonas_salina.1